MTYGELKNKNFYINADDIELCMNIPAGIAPPFQQMGTAIPEIRYRYSCSWIPRI